MTSKVNTNSYYQRNPAKLKDLAARRRWSWSWSQGTRYTVDSVAIFVARVGKIALREVALEL